MNFEPQKFFIGLVGFFSVLMPGALLAYLGKEWIAETFLVQGLYALDGAEEWLVFLFVAYLLGHFAFLVGSTLDDLVYTPLREATEAGQIGRLARGKPLSDPRLRRFAASRWLFARNADAAVRHARRLKGGALEGLGADDAINTYQWAKITLSRQHPEGLLTVERFEADSKFFRSFSVVLVVLVPILLWQLRIVAALVSALLVLPALWRYVDQRFKATQQAYWHLLSLAAESPDPARLRQVATPLAPRGPDGLTHAGGVLFRRSTQGVEYLLVETSSGGEWVLPKGHIEPFEPPTETAAREVLEEAGIWARVVAPVGDVDLVVAGRGLSVRFFLMEAVETARLDGTATPEGRRQQWLPYEQALSAATHEETRDLLTVANRLRGSSRR